MGNTVTNISVHNFLYSFLFIYTQEWNCWVVGFSFRRDCQTGFESGGTTSSSRWRCVIVPVFCILTNTCSVFGFKILQVVVLKYSSSSLEEIYGVVWATLLTAVTITCCLRLISLLNFVLFLASPLCKFPQVILRWPLVTFQMFGCWGRGDVLIIAFAFLLGGVSRPDMIAEAEFCIREIKRAAPTRHCFSLCSLSPRGRLC